MRRPKRARRWGGTAFWTVELVCVTRYAPRSEGQRQRKCMFTVLECTGSESLRGAHTPAYEIVGCAQVDAAWFAAARPVIEVKSDLFDPSGLSENIDCGLELRVRKVCRAAAVGCSAERCGGGGV